MGRPGGRATRVLWRRGRRPTLPRVSDRHDRQIRFPPIGAAGQRRIAGSTVLVVGLGALGSVAAEMLCRAGVGRLRLLDRDVLEASNLQRQSLYAAADAQAGLPKAIAAARRLHAIDAGVACEPIVGELRADTVRDLLAGCALAIDGTDNFPTRHVLNEACCEAGVPWIYAACVGATALSLPILPGETPCLRCLQDALPPAGEGPTCDTAGIIAPAAHVAAGWMVAEALKILVGDRAAVRRELWMADLWAGELRRLRVAGGRDPACRACSPGADRPALRSRDAQEVVLCGREAVQVRLRGPVDVARLAGRLGARAAAANEYLVRWSDGDLAGTCFRDGRVLVHGTAEAARARAFCDRWIGG